VLESLRMHPSTRVALAVGAFLLLQELALRAVFPVPEVLNFDRLQYSHMEFAEHAAAPLALGHASYTWASDPDGFSFVHALNLYGFRDDEWRLEKPAGATRVAIFGDSFVEGLSAAAHETIPASMAAIASQAGETLDVMNFGIAGGDLPGYARLMRDALPLFAPDHVVLMLYANDILPTRFDPAWLRDGLEAEFAHPWSPRLLHLVARLANGQPAPRRWRAPPVEYLPAVPDPRNPWSNGRTAGRLQAFVEPDVARAIAAGRFNPVLVDALPWYRKHLTRPFRIDAHVRALAAYALERGASFHVAYIPTKNQISDRYLPAQARFSPPESVASQLGDEYQVQARLLDETCRLAGVPFLDLTPLLRAADASDGPLYWDYDDHMREAGYRFTAAALHAWLASAGD
jgi:lysophospholipase L1-like esterase